MADLFGTEAFEETINGGDGYDLDSWVETADTGCSIDPDSAADAGISGLGDEILECISASSSNPSAYIYRGHTAKSTVFYRGYFRPYSNNFGNNDGQFGPMVLYSTGLGDVIAYFVLFNTGNKDYLLAFYYNGTDYTEVATSYEITLNTWYRLEIKWVSGSEVEFRIYAGHGTTPVWSENVSSGVGSASSDVLIIGLHAPVGSWTGDVTLYADLIAGDDADWVGPAPTGQTYYETISGEMPSSSGSIMKQSQIGLQGALPAAAGVILKDISLNLSGAMPASSGAILKAISTALTGSMPSPAADLFKEIAISIDGDMPASSATLATQLVKLITLYGNMPAPQQSGEALKDTKGDDLLDTKGDILRDTKSGGFIHLWKQININPQGNMPASSGTILKAIFTALTGFMPYPSAVLPKEISILLDGDMPSASATVAGILVKLISLAGDMPAPSGSIVSKEIQKILTGDMPYSTSTISRLISKALAGDMPASSADTLKEIDKFLSGEMPFSTATLGTQYIPGGGDNYYETISGDMPAPSGLLSKQIIKVLSGDMPAPDADLIKQINKNLSGDMPNPVATLVTAATFLQSLLGDMPSQTGALKKNTQISLTGNMPASSGLIYKKVLKTLTGTMGAISGVIQKVINFNVSGNMPNPIGSAYKSITNFLSGAMPSASGSLSTILNPVSGFRKLRSILGAGIKKLLGG